MLQQNMDTLMMLLNQEIQDLELLEHYKCLQQKKIQILQRNTQIFHYKVNKMFYDAKHLNSDSLKAAKDYCAAAAKESGL
jgi:hypothetical protein